MTAPGPSRPRTAGRRPLSMGQDMAVDVTLTRSAPVRRFLCQAHPRPALGGAEHRVQGGGAAHRVVQGGAVGGALGHGTQEVVRLDDLEVVVAHAGGRARLEGGVAALPGAGEDGADRLVLVSGPGADAELAHAPEVPEDGALRAVDLEAVVVLLADRDA